MCGVNAPARSNELLDSSVKALQIATCVQRLQPTSAARGVRLDTGEYTPGLLCYSGGWINDLDLGADNLGHG